MTTAGQDGRRRGFFGPRTAAVAVVLVTVATALWLRSPSTPGPAETVDAVVVPADGSRLATGPTEVRLRLPGPPDPDEAHVSLTPAQGPQVATGASRRDGTELVVSVPALPQGSYTVAYHVWLADGRQSTGRSVFAVGAAPLLPPADVAPATGHQHVGTDPLDGLLLVLDLGLLVALSVILLRRPKVASDPEDPPEH
ncbi:hypothetical protein TPA0907_18750 [Micromonospora humidisoli]|uniref:Copper resistance protein CopC n=1 Tax=Micromonospora humidisoli TaxID=2807622 RepID=A0ABS2JHM7_9ACTN|nr:MULTISPECIES: copper resistance CopC family protein [Micromonospora]MBM7085278.1 copper resistance protein CopC [Micromonospora humidisoli]GHJ07508.1 hypothetical protein TPA0907_18750 [Micromonospora sp. AKA109]